MIKASELRIGNMVLIDGHGDNVFKVLDIGSALSTVSGGPVFKTEYEEMHPIPLTPEWLERCGFEYNKSNDIWFKDGMNEFITFHYDGFVVYESSKKLVIKSLHQLQNLYFALTGEELTINHEHL